ncbi:hypothetical protein [Streptomyces lydicus]|uniref:hypothetical protein n=1 Tax=Streptomyces lydicus TaxID=47763 RepID=UPI0010103985|nr:hypothetical protein [Streptomyces lydicus]MCZ1006366.1 hypothetical protein [Streptomyces lydicus]
MSDTTMTAEQLAEELLTTRRRLSAPEDGARLLAELQRNATRPVLEIVSAWCVESNDIGGIDAGDLAWRLEQAGYPLPGRAPAPVVHDITPDTPEN